MNLQETMTSIETALGNVPADLSGELAKAKADLAAVAAERDKLKADAEATEAWLKGIAAKLGVDLPADGDDAKPDAATAQTTAAQATTIAERRQNPQ